MITKRTIAAITSIFTLPCSYLIASQPDIWKKISVFFVALFQLFGALLFDWPVQAQGDPIDMRRFELVWSDEFNTGQLDLTKWGGHYIWGQNDSYLRDAAWWHMEQVSFDDENLIITAQYRDTGLTKPERSGFYSCGIDTSPGHNFLDRQNNGYEQLYGYFEIRCIFPEGDGFNPAFWLLNEGMFEGSTSGIGGCEIDVFETKTQPSGKTKRWKDSIFQTIHVGSYEENHQQEIQGFFKADNPTQQYNTYGVEWNEDAYIFYINGVESARTDFAGVCQKPLYLIISLGMDEHAVKEQLPAQFIIDYVRAYQYK